MILIDYCKKKGVKFLSTAFDLDSIDFLAEIHLGLWKIPSGEITNYPYLRKIAQRGEPVILSSGMSGYREIEDALAVLEENGVRHNDIIILHCNTEYPTPMEDVNLRAMQSIAERFHVEVGYSDHTRGIEVPIAAVALGASVIEKHFTLSRKMEGPDHKASLEPAELKYMVDCIRNIELALGDGIKRPNKSEIEISKVVLKSIVAKRRIQEGEELSVDNLTVKRAEKGISASYWNLILGKRATKNYDVDEPIQIR